MHKFLFSSLILSATFAHGQDKRALDSVDKVIINQIIAPAEQSAASQEPSWTAILLQIKATYSDTQADRAITKAQIYYYYNKNWPKFSTAIVHYTETYEDKDDLKLMNKNANFILQHSTDPKELATARSWMKHAIEKEPSNETYKTTYDALGEKL
jgi:hypothetical protein